LAHNENPPPFGFALNVFLSAFLLFQVQLMMGKYILPWFGGTPAVWTACMLFFQVALLAGYAYAHFIAQEGRFTPKMQANIHVGLLCIAVLTMVSMWFVWKAPILPGPSFKPNPGESEVWDIVKMLAAGVGLPFVLLSTTGPLMQAWFARVAPDQSPYRLYALSNVGSLLGLFSYPFVMEPGLRLVTQAQLWSVLFFVFAMGTTYCARVQMRAEGSASTDTDGTSTDEEIFGWGRRLLWVALATVPSMMLLATTNMLTQEVATIPFLWMLPLATYLLSFIICFESEQWYRRVFFHPFFFISVLGALCMVVLYRHHALWLQILAHCSALFGICMVCHGEMVRRKPAHRHLTAFYLSVSVGGALGGIFVALVAPHIFTWFWEFFLAIIAAVVLLIAMVITDKASWWHHKGVAVIIERVAVLVACFFIALLFVQQWKNYQLNTLVRIRNFYGSVAVLVDPAGPVWGERNGMTIHGMQFQDAKMRLEPTMYYDKVSGIGLLLGNHPKRYAVREEDRSLRVGLVGLGIGTLAAYAKPGDYYRFYEINPVVIALAHGPQQKFTYLDQTAAKFDIVEGDARLSMERELAAGVPQKFDLIVVDAFSSDAIPTHLLTEEAFAVYFAHLRGPESMIAFHTSNFAIDLNPVLVAAANHFHLEHRRVRYSKPTEDIGAKADWIFMARNPYVLQSLNEVGTKLSYQDPLPPWTDDYSNLLDVIKK